jgi:hypothetical protein
VEYGEVTFNDLLIFPFLKAVAKAVAEETSSDAELKVREAALAAMKKQIKRDSDASIYLADGIIKLYVLCDLEVLLLETPSRLDVKTRRSLPSIIIKVFLAAFLC